MEHIIESVLDQTKNVIDSKEIATKHDLKELEVKIEQYRYESLKFIVWTGIGVVVVLGGMLAKGFHWW